MKYLKLQKDNVQYKFSEFPENFKGLKSLFEKTFEIDIKDYAIYF